MGASVSTNVSNIVTKINNKAYNNCETGGTTQVLDISGINFNPSEPACGKNSVFSVGQYSTVDAKCLISSMQSATAEEAVKLNANAQAGIGIAVSTNVSDMTTSINNVVKNKCKGQSITQAASLKDINSTSCVFNVVQNASMMDACIINETQSIANKISNQLGASSTGLFGGSIMKYLLIVLAILIVVSIAFLLIKIFIGKSGKSKTTVSLDELNQVGAMGYLNAIFNQSGGNNISGNRTFTIITIIVVLLLVLFLINRLSSKKNNYLDDNDIQNLYGPNLYGPLPRNFDRTELQNWDDVPQIQPQESDWQYKQYPLLNSTDNNLDRYYAPLNSN